MMYRSFITLLGLGLVALVGAKSIDIDVGEDGNLTFVPDTSTAAVGDTLEFHFYSGSGGHSVVSSSFDSPCVPNTGAFFSGYIPGDDTGDTTFVVTVTSMDPIWFYCSFKKHCQNGMVGVVNPPSGKSASDYAKAAAPIAAASAPNALVGGVLTTIEDSSSTTAASSGSASATSSPASTTGGSTTASTTGSGTGSVASTTSSPASSGSSAGTSATSSRASGGSSTAFPSSSSGAPAATAGATNNGVNLGLGVILGGLVAAMA